MRSYENSGFNPFNDTDTIRTRGSARNYYSGDMDLTDRRRTSYGSSAASGYGNRNSGMGSGIDAYSNSGTGRTTGSFYDSPRGGASYGRSDYGSSDNYGSSNYGSGNRYGSNRDNDNDRSFWDKAENKVSSWFNDDDNDNRRRGGMSNRDSYSSYDSDRNSGRNSYGSGTYGSGSSYSGNYGSGNSGSGNYGSGTYGTGYTTSNYGTDYDRSGSEYGRSSNYGSGSSGSGSNYGSSNYGSSNYGSGNRDRMGYRSDNNYGSGNRYGSDYDRNNHGDNDRGFLEKAGDTVKSWFGDDDNDRRRSYENRDRNSYGSSSGNTGSRNTYSGPPYSYGSSSRRDYEW